MLSAANNSPNEVLGNEKKPNDFTDSYVLIGLSVSNLLELSLNSFYKLKPHQKIKFFITKTRNQLGFEDCSTCTFCLVERKVTLIDHAK